MNFSLLSSDFGSKLLTMLAMAPPSEEAQPSAFGGLLPFILIFAALWFLLSRWHKKRKAELESARIAYKEALLKLSEDSSKANKVAALEAGRHYADVARGQSGLGRRAVFDEVALQNDLSAYGD